MQTKRKHDSLSKEAKSILSSGRPNPLPPLKLKLDEAARSFRDDIIPARIEYLQSIVSTKFNQPFWEPVDAPHITPEGSAYKKPKVDINSLHEQHERALVTAPEAADSTCTYVLNERLEQKLEILKMESKYLAAVCSSLQLREALNTSRARDDSLLEIFTATQQQALKLRSCLAKFYEERATLLSGRVMESGGAQQGVRASFEKALEEYDTRIEELAGCQVVTLIASYVSILDTLEDSSI